MHARLLLLLLLLAGCGGGTDVENPEHIASWANTASALAVFIPAYEPIATADGELTFDDPSCPVVVDDGTTLTITGGCTNEAGMRWNGEATVVRGAGGGYDLTLEEYGKGEAGSALSLVTGSFIIAPTGDGAHTFDADYVQDGILTLDVDYEGSVRGSYDTATVWSGTGTVTRGGSTDASGTATVTTIDQLRDWALCNNQSVSGSTTIEIDERTVVVEYDGATDCDDALTARYSVDGEDRGAVANVACAASSPGRPTSTWVPLLLLAALLGLRKRG